MRDERGFTLLEVLIAVVIATVVFGALMQASLSGIRLTRSAGGYEMAIALARSHLAMLGRNMATVPPDSHGQDGPFEWRIRVTPEATDNPGAGIVNWFQHKDEARTTLYAVSIVISWSADGRRPSLRLTTQRLGFAPPISVTP
jgi:prepilin-type N-terminal cleavage/methylation domain-containing protein